jgi:hypothetical protein
MPRPTPPSAPTWTRLVLVLACALEIALVWALFDGAFRAFDLDPSPCSRRASCVASGSDLTERSPS